MSKTIGYARVSTIAQNPEMQHDDLRAYGIDQLYTDTVSGVMVHKPAFEEAMDYMRAGDTLVVWKLDRLGRSMRQLVELMEELRTRQIEFVSLKDGIDTTTMVGRFTFHIFAAVAEFERDQIRERTRAGLQAAKARGKSSGRPPALSPADIKKVRQRRAQGIPVDEIAATFKVGRTTIYRALSDNGPVGIYRNT